MVCPLQVVPNKPRDHYGQEDQADGKNQGIVPKRDWSPGGRFSPNGAAKTDALWLSGRTIHSPFRLPVASVLGFSRAKWSAWSSPEEFAAPRPVDLMQK